MLFWAVSIFAILSLLNDGRSLAQQGSVYFVYMVFIIQSIVALLKHISSEKTKKIAILILTIIYCFSFSSFLHFYFTEYNTHTSKVNLMAAKVPEELDQQETKVYFLKHYIYYLASRDIHPDDFPADDENVFKYNNIVFNLYIEDGVNIDTNCIYVAYYNDQVRTQILNEYHFEKQRIGDYIFYMPIEKECG